MRIGEDEEAGCNGIGCSICGGEGCVVHRAEGFVTSIDKRLNDREIRCS
jgi:hypothetical protein